MERRLAAILAADVVGYSHLMEADEEATVRALNVSWRLVDRLVADHGGRVFGSAGDSVVAEFPSPVEAVRCAVDIQRELATRDVELPEDRRILLRIGVNLGDVVVEGDNLLGEGVNVAARLEAIADAGGIRLSRPVFDQVKKKLDLGYEYLGAHEVKNIAEPVRVYRVLTDPKEVGRIIGERKPAKQAWRWAALAAATVMLIGVVAAIGWLRPRGPTVEPAAVERMAFPLPEKPSIAVLPFDNLSGDAGQDHLADGLTEDIIAALSQAPGLFVIARNSTFVYKGTPVKVQRVAEELGVRYVLEGSVQRSGERLRITAQLIDALAGYLLWGERYDRDYRDIFALHDEITERIVTALRIRLTEGEQARVHRKHTRSVEAWNLFSRAMEPFHRFNKAGNAIARQLLEEAVEVDPEYALAYAVLAWTHWQDAFLGWSEDRDLSIERAALLADKAQALDDSLPDVYALQGAIHLFRGEYGEAVEAAEKAVAYNPNHASNTALLAMILHNVGRPQEAIGLLKTAMRLSPYYPDWFLEELGFVYLVAGRPEDALLAFEKFLEREPGDVHAAHAHVGRALAFAGMGRNDEAQAAVAAAVEADAGLSLAQFGRLSLNKDRTAVERGLAVLRRLGLPE